jgi:predicted DNA-binding transcriptional regulator AlpA
MEKNSAEDIPAEPKKRQRRRPPRGMIPDGRGWLSPDEAAVFLGYSRSWLQAMRSREQGPPYAKLNGRSVRYLKDDLVEWLDQRKGQKNNPLESQETEGKSQLEIKNIISTEDHNKMITSNQ